MAIPEGYEIVNSGIPEGYEVVSDDMSAGDIATGLADIVGAGAYGVGELVAAGVPAAIATVATGEGVRYGAPLAGAIEEAIPDYKMGDDAQRLVGEIGELYKTYAPEVVQNALTAMAQSPESVMKAGEESGSPLVADLSALLATGLKIAPELIGSRVGAKVIPETTGKTVAATQRLLSTEKRDIARQLERRQPVIPSESKDLVPVESVDLWGQDAVIPDSDDLGLSGYTTTTAPYKLSPTGRVIANPKHKIAQDAGFSNQILGVIERANPETKAKYRQMVDSKERLYEIPEESSKYDPVIVTGGSLENRLNVVKKVNKDAGKAIDKYVNKKLAQVEINPLPVMNDLAQRWQSKGITLNPETGRLDFGELELSKAGMDTVNDIFQRMKREVKGQVTGKTLHNLKRIVDEKIAYGKDVEGLDAKTQGVLRDFRRSISDHLETQFPEYAKANAHYSKTIDVIDRVQKSAGKVDLDGEYSMSNLGRMSRAIMSQRVSRDEILTVIEDLDKLSSDYGRAFKDDLKGQVHFANQLDDIWGPSRATGFAGQTKQGTAAGIVDIGADGIQGGMAVGKKALEMLKKKELDDKQKFKAMKELLKETR